MKLTNAFDVPLPLPEAWPLLLDVERIVPCVPGAELIGKVDERTYKGRVTARLGPVTLTFDGEAVFKQVDADSHRAFIEARGTDKKGRGGAHAKVTFQAEPAAGNTRVTIDTDLQLSGAVAQYGRASGMIADVASEIIGQFAACLGRRIAATKPGVASDAVPAAVGTEPRPIAAFGLLWKVLWNAIRRFFGTLVGNKQAR